MLNRMPYIRNTSQAEIADKATQGECIPWKEDPPFNKYL